MQSVLIMTKEYDNYHAIQFHAENEQQLNQLNQLEQLKSQVRKREIMLGRMLMPFEVETLYTALTSQNQL